MRKIKSFKLFESVDPFPVDLINSIKKEAEDNLAYLLDEGQFKISCDMDSKFSSYLSVTIEIINKREFSRYNLDKIFWESIKDEVMPYLELVSDKYTLWSFRTGY